MEYKSSIQAMWDKVTWLLNFTLSPKWDICNIYNVFWMQHIERGDFVAMGFLRYRWKHSEKYLRLKKKKRNTQETC